MVVTAERDIEAVRAAAQCVVQTHFALADFLRAGRSLAEIDAFVAETLDVMDCRSAFLRYKIPGHPPFPSHSCLSVNDCIVHGTHLMSDKPLEPGDILSIDIGVAHPKTGSSWIGDAAWTYAIEHASEEAHQLMACGRESLARGIAAMQPGRPLVDWAKAVQGYVEGESGLHLVRGLGGHGYGRKLHGPPFIANVVPGAPGEWPDAFKRFQPGMLLAVEPMLASGTNAIKSNPREWPIFTADGSLSVHYEANVLITEEGPRDLTEGMSDLPDVVG